MSSQQHLYNGLARAADYSIFCMGMATVVQQRTSPHGQQTAYGQRTVCEPMLTRDRHRDAQQDGQGQNTMTS